MQFKEVMISCVMHLPYLKQILSNWATQNRIIPPNSKGLVRYTKGWSPSAMVNMVEEISHKY